MERIIRQVSFPGTERPRLKRVAAYARVSSGKDAMLHSLSAQISAYSDLIQNHEGWQYCGVYTDEAFTGTKEEREGFQSLLADCRAGKLDMVITKTISRFARNTVTLLQTVRELKCMGVDIYFEEQEIHSISTKGEVMMTFLASYAQEESLSASENQKWRVRRNFEKGIPWRFFMLGYRAGDGKLAVVPEEAEIVRSIFTDYLAGDGVTVIANRLNKSGYVTQGGSAFHKSAVERILRNYAYTGNLLLQTKFRENHLTKVTRKNHGELPKYHAQETHEAIIPLEMFQKVQDEIERRKAKYGPKKERQLSSFTGLITCECCGKHYRRKTTATGPIWICTTYNSKGKAFCASKAIPEQKLYEIAAQVGVPDTIQGILAQNGNKLVFTLQDGTTVTKHWTDRSRAESWTPEMRRAVGQNTRERNQAAWQR